MSNPMAETQSAPSLREWVLVPREPTEEMMEAGAKARLSTSERKSLGLYRAMIAAAPSLEVCTQGLAPQIATAEGPWGVEDCGHSIWVGPMRADGFKVDRVVYGVQDLMSHTPEARSRYRAEAYLVANSVNAALAAAPPTTLSEAVASARAEGVREGLERAAGIADDWVRVEGGRAPRDVKNAQTWANAAVSEIAEAIRKALPTSSTTPGGRTDG